jgi:hypothetical protein
VNLTRGKFLSRTDHPEQLPQQSDASLARSSTIRQSGDAVVMADARALDSILTNLIQNAVTHGHATEIEIRIDEGRNGPLRPSELRTTGVVSPAISINSVSFSSVMAAAAGAVWALYRAPAGKANARRHRLRESRRVRVSSRNLICRTARLSPGQSMLIACRTNYEASVAGRR